MKGCQYKIPASVQVIKQIIDITKSKLIREYECISRIPLVDHISFTVRIINIQSGLLLELHQ